MANCYPFAKRVLSLKISELVERNAEFAVKVLVLVIFVTPAVWLVTSALHATGALNSDDAPAWVQAVGSIGAIIAAMWIAGRQQREQMKVNRRRERVVATVAIEIAERAATGMMLTDTVVANRPSIGKISIEDCISYMDRELKAISRLDLAALPHHDMVRSVLQLISNIEIMIRKISEYSKGTPNLPKIIYDLKVGKEVFDSIAAALRRHSELN